jgi:hypothetical protein
MSTPLFHITSTQEHSIMKFSIERHGFCIATKSFELDTRGDFYIKLPYIGAGHRYPGGGFKHPWTWSWWSELKATGEV